jgi:hypothetical protein
MNMRLNLKTLFLSALVALAGVSAKGVTIPGGTVVIPAGGVVTANYLITHPANAAYISDYLFGAVGIIPLSPVGFDTEFGGGPHGIINPGASSVDLI